MYITVQNSCSDRETNEGTHYVCGYIQVDNEKPMKIQSIRLFKVSDGYHTIKYMSEYPSSSPKYSDSVSGEFENNDWVNIMSYAFSSGVYLAPHIEVHKNVDAEIINGFEDNCSTYRQIIEDDYQRVKSSIKSQRYNPKMSGFPDKAKDEWEKGALEFIDTVDKRCCLVSEEFANWKGPWEKGSTSSSSSSSGSCYVATCVYGSYDCPEVWTLRRFRDNTLASTWYGRLFIRIYYAVSPTIVKCFGKTKWFTAFFKSGLDKMVAKLHSDGVDDTPYNDKQWK